MFIKSATLIIAITATGAGLLQLRHERVQIMYDMATMHRQIDRMRHSMWDSQAKMAQHLQSNRLETAIDRKKLELEPLHRSRLRSAMPQALAATTRSGDIRR